MTTRRLDHWYIRFLTPKGVEEITHHPRVWNLLPKAPRSLSSSVSTSILLRKFSRRRVKEITKTKKPSNPVNTANLPSWRISKGCTRPRTPRKRRLTKIKQKNSPVCPLHVPEHDMNLCKVMLPQAKAMKLTWSTDRSGGAGRVRFQGNNNLPAKIKDMNSLVSNAVKEFIKS